MSKTEISPEAMNQITDWVSVLLDVTDMAELDRRAASNMSIYLLQNRAPAATWMTYGVWAFASAYAARRIELGEILDSRQAVERQAYATRYPR